MRRLLILAMVVMFACASLANAAVITIINNDGVGEGFNDPTPAAPVGGNNGMTVGQQRLNVFQKAADIWGGILPSSVTIVVRAQFNPQTCTTTSAVLGSAGPSEFWRDFPGAPLANTWYHVALANKLTGSDLNPGLYDINATFNSNLNGQASCLNGIGWYLGFDGNEGTNIELLPVVLHELGHGLGFSTATSGTTGNELGGIPDRYERYIRDNTLGTTWDNMTAAQRVASAINTGNVVWNGPCVTAHAPFVLGGSPKLWVNAGGPLNATYPLGLAAFGPQTFSTTGNVVLVDDGVGTTTDACEALINGGAVSGNIALLDRGTCAFVVKAQMAQAAGAIAVLVANNAAGPPIALGGADPSITIPVVCISQQAGIDMKAALLNGAVNVTIGFDPNELSGADSSNRVKLYAPNPFQSGSSISHFDTSAFPNLLMEPAINSSLSSTVDLTFWMFGDIGWHDVCTTPVAVAISSFNAFVTDGGVKLKATFFSSLADADFVVVYRAKGGSDEFRSLATVNAPLDGRFSFLDDAVAPGEAYRYKISVIDGDGEFFSQTAEVRLPGARIELSQNVPNPFNPVTSIRFSLPASERVSLVVYSASGAVVRTLVNGVKERGNHDITWDGRDNAGSPVSTGVYFYRLTAGKYSDTKKMVLLK